MTFAKQVVSALVCLSIFASCARRSAGPDLKETFAPEDARPMGTKLAHSMIRDAWPEAYVSLQKYKLSNSYFGSDSNRLYVNICRNFYSDVDDANVLYDFVRKGNTALIVTANADSSLLRMAGVEQRTNYADLFKMIPYASIGSYYANELGYEMNYPDTARFVYTPVRYYFPVYNTSDAKIVSYSDKDSVNCYVVFIGQGKLFLHSEPAFFSNYFLLQKNNARYLESLLRILPENINTIYADDYYWKASPPDRRKKFSSLSAIFASPPLAAAFWIFLALFAMYVFFNSKRRQRVIPVQAAERNSSVSFAEAMSRVYLAKKDNRLIASKMINQFHEGLRGRYFTTLSPRDAAYADFLTRKTGAQAEEAAHAARLIKHALTAYSITDQELLNLNDALEKLKH